MGVQAVSALFEKRTGSGYARGEVPWGNSRLQVDLHPPYPSCIGIDSGICSCNGPPYAECQRSLSGEEEAAIGRCIEQTPIRGASVGNQDVTITS